MTFPSKDGSNYTDSVVALVLLPLIWIFISIRIHIRGFITKQLGWDDITAVIAVIIYTLECVSVWLLNAVSSSAQQSPGGPTQDKVILKFKWYLTTASAYTVSCFFVKLSLGLGFLRILKFRHIDPHWERLACYAVIAISCAVNLQLFFVVIFECAAQGYMPQDAAYALALRICPLANKHVLISTYIQSVVSVIVDFILVLLPIPSIMKSIMDRRTRTSIIGILVLGVVGSIASIIKVAYIHTFFSKDANVGSVGIVVANVEIGAFLIFGCLATFHPLLTRHTSATSEGFSHSESFHIESFDMVHSEPKSGSSSRQHE
ncbi:hypothetical protein EJ08DRAFT_703515 [Tothia fuscella]|uniref:Rhodopsin domain-containing protein n=1 Tax=Tothia fuscella TaxID=1048955 RepID=A0A9P4NEK3_9PEZI|nr:hypothetical protein EJ08DRAFT_703515 [Tothia fuscella]